MEMSHGGRRVMSNRAWALIRVRRMLTQIEMELEEETPSEVLIADWSSKVIAEMTDNMVAD